MKIASSPGEAFPVWYDGRHINESRFCQQYLSAHQLCYTEGAFFTPEGCMVDERPLKVAIFQQVEPYAALSVARKITGILELLKIIAHVEELPPQDDRIHLQNGTLHLDGTFCPEKREIVRSRFPVAYRPDAPQPETWLRFLENLLYAEDIPTLQEYVGYCLIPSNKGQRMMMIKGNGGEGKSQIGNVLSRIFGCNAKDGSVGKVSENRFARADLEHIHLMIDDDMRMEALKQTNYVKSLVTAQGKMDLERKGRQSYQGWMYARLLAFSNGDLQALYNALKEHTGVVTTIVDGIAASAASVIAMAGERVEITPVGMLMIHDPMTSLEGGRASQFRRTADVLDKVKETIVNAYTLKTGLDRQEIARMMEEETYMTPMEAVRLGFADTIRNANSEKTGVVNGLYSRKKGAAVYDDRLKDAIAAVCLKLEEATFSANYASRARHEDTQGADALLEEARRRLALRGRLGNRQTF